MVYKIQVVEINIPIIVHFYCLAELLYAIENCNIC